MCEGWIAQDDEKIIALWCWRSLTGLSLGSRPHRGRTCRLSVRLEESARRLAMAVAEIFNSFSRFAFCSQSAVLRLERVCAVFKRCGEIGFDHDKLFVTCDEFDRCCGRRAPWENGIKQERGECMCKRCGWIEGLRWVSRGDVEEG